MFACLESFFGGWGVKKTKEGQQKAQHSREEVGPGIQRRGSREGAARAAQVGGQTALLVTEACNGHSSLWYWHMTTPEKDKNHSLAQTAHL